MARIDYPSTLSPLFLDAAGTDPINITRMLAHAEPVALGLLHFGGKLLGESELDARLRELVILRVCALTNCAYEANQHAHHARAAGAAEAEIAAVATRADHPLFSKIDAAVLRFAENVVSSGRAGDSEFAEVRLYLSDRMIVELLLVIGFYTMICNTIETLAIDDEPE